MENKLNLKNIIGEQLLNRIQNSYLAYVESSAAIYEVNGDYAAAIFSSRYCDYLNQASRKKAGKTDDEALKSGKWICHEDCWAASLKSIKEKKPCEIECSGGIKIYAAPIIADGTVIGSNNVGLSNPPTDEKKIGEIAQTYKVDPKELLRIAKEYSPRPEHILNAVKNHVLVAAETIAEFFLRIKTEEALQMELNFSESLIKTAQVIVLLLDTKGRIKDFNPFMEEISGYRLKEVQGKDWFKIFLQEHDRDRIRNLFLKAIDDIQTRGNVNPIITKDGRKLTIEWYDRTIKDVSGNTVGLLAIGMDITERKKAEEELQKTKEELEQRVNERTAELSSTVELLQKEITHRNKIEKALQESENRYRTVIEDQTEIICRFYPDGTYTFVNDVYCRFFGKSKEELIGRKWLPDAYAEDLEMIQAKLSTMSPQNPVVVIENRVFSGDGVLRWMQFVNRGFYDQDGNLLEVQSVGRDISELKKTETALKLSEEKYRNIVDTSIEGIWIIDSQGNTSFVNHQMTELLGYTEEEIIGRHLFDFMDEEGKKEARRKLELRRKGITERHDFRFKKKDGTDLWAIVSTNPIMNNKGEFTGALGMITDITDRMKAEEKVKASLKEKEVLLQEIHHRVKNNMTVISSLLKLQADRVQDEHYREMFNNSINRIKSMALIHEKLYKSKDLAKVDFNDYFKDMVKSMFISYGLSSHKIALKTDIEDVAFGLDTAIPCGLIINELVSNSLKHAFPEDGHGEIKVSLRRNDKAAVELTVSDNGVGMPEDVDFRKTDSLGLNLVNALVGQLQGEIALNREKGTKFIIIFKGITV